MLAGNREAFVQTVSSVYKAPQTITEAVNDLRSIQPHLVGYRALLMAEYAGKGWFAIMLAEELDHQVALPPYILQAIHFAHGHISAPLLARILQYRAARQIEVDPLTQPRLALFRVELDRYQRGDIDLVGFKAAVALALPSDAIGSFMAGIA